MSENIEVGIDIQSTDVEQDTTEAIVQNIPNYLMLMVNATHYLAVDATHFLGVVKIVLTGVSVVVVDIGVGTIDVEGVPA